MQHTDEEINIIFNAMIQGTIEHYLSGECILEEELKKEEQFEKFEKSEIQLIRCNEILTYIKR